jgi:hypothetical protein
MMGALSAKARHALAGVGEFLLEPATEEAPIAEPAPAETFPEAEPRRAASGRPPLVLATAAPSTGGGVAAAAALGVAVARNSAQGILLVEIGAEGAGRRPTLLASDAARRLEDAVRADRPELRVAARGNLCWLAIPSSDPDCDPEDSALARLARLQAAPLPAALIVAHMPPALWRQGLERPDLRPVGGLVRADLPAQRPLAALAVHELRERRLIARIASRPLGAVGSRRALAGLDPGGMAARRSARQAAALTADAPRAGPPRTRGDAFAAPLSLERGQALPLVIGACFALIFAALLLVAIGGAVAGKSRLQRAADLAAVSAARSMRDDLDRLLGPARLPNGSLNPRHLPREAYFARAKSAARQAVDRNGLDPGLLRVSFPDADSFAPLQARVRVTSNIDASGLTGPMRGRARRPEVVARATAEAAPPPGFSGMPSTASGGGYSGPLAYRQGEGMRPDVAEAFDRLAAAARRDGLGLVITSGYRSDAEQAELFAQNPDPRWVAPPGQSLHRCATELDLGPAAAYGWLAANAPRFGFVKRYPWEPWHFGWDRGPAPCSEDGNSIAGGSGDGRAGGGGVPAFVPAAYRATILAAASRWNVSAALLAAQVMAESGFDPQAVSPAGAQGIAQFMPGTAVSYGLRDPFDPEQAIDAQAHLMSDLLEQFGSVPLALAAYNAGPAPVAACDCVPSYPETQAYVTRILALLGGSGELAVPPLEVRLVA